MIGVLAADEEAIGHALVPVANQNIGEVFDLSLVLRLAELLDRSRLTRLEIEHGDQRIRIVRDKVRCIPAVAAVTSSSGHNAAVVPPTPIEPPLIIRSSFVGTAYLAGMPNGEPFTAIGRNILAGDMLLIIDVMKVQIPILAPYDGVVAAIRVETGSPVEFDQPLVEFHRSV